MGIIDSLKSLISQKISSSKNFRVDIGIYTAIMLIILFSFVKGDSEIPDVSHPPFTVDDINKKMEDISIDKSALSDYDIAAEILSKTGITCGDGICDSSIGETPDTCCYDCQCPDGLSCVAGLCTEIKNADPEQIRLYLSYIGLKESSKYIATTISESYDNMLNLGACLTCLVEIGGAGCDICKGSITYFLASFIGLFGIEEKDVANTCGKDGQKLGDIEVPYLVILSSFIIGLLWVILYIVDKTNLIKKIETMSYEELVETEQTMKEEDIASEIETQAIKEVEKDKRTGVVNQWHIIKLMIIIIARPILIFMVLAGIMDIILYFAGYEADDCLNLGIKVSLGFIWAYFSIMIISGAITSFGVETITDGDLEEYYEKDVASKLVNGGKLTYRGHVARENAMFPERVDIQKEKFVEGLREAIGMGKTGKGEKKEIGFFYLEDFLGLPTAVAKILIDPFRHPAIRILLVILLLHIFQPANQELFSLITLVAISIGGYIVILMGWYSKTVLVRIAALIAEKIFSLLRTARDSVAGQD